MSRSPTANRTDLFADRLARRRARLSPALLRIAEFIEANRLTVLASSAIEIARAAGTSDATVVRTVQALGFSGLADLRRQLAASLGEGTAPVENLRRTLADAEEDIDAALGTVLEAYAAGLAVLQSPEFHTAIHAALEVLRQGHRIVVFGIGPTAHIAHYFAARLRRKGIAAAVIDRTGSELADQLLDLAPGDALLMMAFGKPYREATVTARIARDRKVPLVLISDTEGTTLARDSRAVLAVPRGRSGRIALNGVTVLCLELLLLGLAAAAPEEALSTLAELERLRQTVRSGRRALPGDGEEPEEFDQP